MIRLCTCLLLSSTLAVITARGEPVHARIVDLGSKLGSGFYRGRTEQKFPPVVDRDGNGTLDNDSVSAWPFSLTQPLNPPGLDYDTDTKSAMFYGGLTVYGLNNPDRRISEGHLNQNHESRDDFNFMALAKPRDNDQLEGYATWFWQKKDFLNGGDRYPVTFDERSFIAVHVSRYWGGIDAGRWLVREGDTFHLSEATFAGENRQFYLDMEPGNKDLDGSRNPVVRRTHSLYPTRTRWAVYSPQEPFTLDFDDTQAVFTTRAFTNVTAVGFFVNRRMSPPRLVNKGLLAHQPMALKWNAFRCDAVIDRPATPSYYADLAPMEGGGWLGRAPVSYALWKLGWRSAVTRQYPLDLGPLGYTFLRDGSMGGMRMDQSPHSTAEPVTDISWWDAILFCNALSEREGLTPCYYSHPDFTNVYRRAGDRDLEGGMDRRPAVFWNPQADGFRLPTLVEWSRGVRPATGFWEYVWDGDRPVCAGPPASATTPLPFPERPFLGSPRLGFRLARGTRSAANDPAGTPSGPAWVLMADQTLVPEQPLIESELKERVREWLNLVPVEGSGLAPEAPLLDRDFAPGKSPQATTPYTLAFTRTEIPYRIWNLVRNWAESRDYSFNYAGDMGSMGRGLAAQTHHPDEPVTMISLWDAMVWCNALSELLERRPAYTTDESGTIVFRHAPLFRLEMFEGLEAPHYAFRTNLPKQWTIHTGAYVPIYLQGTADGFRLPLPAEWTVANQPLAGKNPLDQEWLAGNSGGKTQTVGTKPPNGAGLCDMEGNVAELMWGSTAAEASMAHPAAWAAISSAVSGSATPTLTRANTPPWDGLMWDSGWSHASRNHAGCSSNRRPPYRAQRHADPHARRQSGGLAESRGLHARPARGGLGNARPVPPDTGRRNGARLL